MNFTGQIGRPRNVNLGGRNAGQTKGKRDAILKNAQAERIRRDRLRAEQKAVLTLQCIYRARKDLIRSQLEMRDKWIKDFSVSPKDTTKANEIVRSLSIFKYFLPVFTYKTTREEQRALLADLCQLIELNAKSLLQNEFKFRFMSDFLDNLWKAVLTVKSHECLLPYVLAISSVLGNVELPSTAINGICEYISGNNQDFPSDKVTDLVLRSFGSHPTEFFGQILILKNLLHRVDTVKLAGVLFQHQLDDSQLSQYRLLSTHDQLTALSNVTSLMDTKVPYYLNKLHFGGALLAPMGVTVTERDSIAPLNGMDFDEDSEDEDDERMDTGNNKKKTTEIFMTGNEIKLVLGCLGERSFTVSLFEYLWQNKGSDEIIDAVSSLYTHLLRVFPVYGERVIMFMSLKSAVSLLWGSFVSTDLYTMLLNEKASLDMFQKFIEVKNSSLWERLTLALHIYSYWLTVALDSEFEDKIQGLPLAEVRNMAVILKRLSYMLIGWLPSRRILEGNSINAGHYNSLKRLKEVSILTARRLYVRDSRSSLLKESDFWVLPEIDDYEVYRRAMLDEERRLSSEWDTKESDQTSESFSTPFPLQQQQQQQQQQQRRRVAPDYTQGRRTPSGMSASTPSNNSGATILSSSAALELLKQVPFLIPFPVRVGIFDVAVDYCISAYESPSTMFGLNRRNRESVIERGREFETAFENFHNMDHEFRKQVSISFVNEYGAEAGIDGGGLTKEMLTCACKEGFSPKRGLFSSTTDHLLYPNPSLGAKINATHYNPSIWTPELRQAAQEVVFLGMLVGKCLFTNTLVNLEFAPFFLRRWVGTKNLFDDLHTFDPELHRSLLNVLHYEGDVENDLGLSFETDTEDAYGKIITVELRPNGSNIPVTGSNRLEYVHAVANYKMNILLGSVSSLFLQGLNKLIPARWVQMFDTHELQLLISGGNAPIDIEDLKSNVALYGYTEADPTVVYLWEVLREMNPSERCKFVKFVTSVPKAPLLGFAQLSPKFAISKAGDDTERLPTSGTCMNLLKIPDYRNKKLLKEKLTYAIEFGAGFDLS